MPRIMLDPGHAGSYFNPSPVIPGYYESNFTWKFAGKLKAALEKRGFEVGLTRQNKDDDPELTERGRMAKGYDLFISLHSNAAASEAPDAPWMIHFSPDPLRAEIVAKSETIAHALGDVVSGVMGVSSPYYYTKTVDFDRDGNGMIADEYYGVLFGSKSVGVPGIIIEHGFHTNRKTAAWLMLDTNLDRLAEAEADALAKYYNMEDIPMTKEEKNAFDALAAKVEAMGETIKELDAQIGIKWAYIDKNLPEWAAPTVKKLAEAGYLKGGDKNSFELSYLMLRIIVMLDRAGVFGE